MRRRNLVRFWPAYFDRRRPRRLGRRLPQNLCFDKITTTMIAKAALALGYHAEVDSTLRYPASWWEPQGCVYVDTQNKKKLKVMKQLATKMREMAPVK